MAQAAVLAAASACLSGCLKLRPAPDERIEATSARVERGAYLANQLLGCIGCHSVPDDGLFSRPPRAGTVAGAGGQCWDARVGFPGVLCAPNLTADDATGLGLYTDGELMRAIREGIDRNGRGLFPLMPYRDYAALSEEDTRAVVAYLRTLPPVVRAVPVKQLDFPVGLFIRLAPRPLEGPVPEPDPQDAVEYGRYLSRTCVRCHSPADSRGRLLLGRELSGGQEFRFADGAASVWSPNLTAHPTGLGQWTAEQFVARFRAAAVPTPVVAAQNTVMPWSAYSGLTDADLSAIWAYLRSVPALENKVAPWRVNSP